MPESEIELTLPDSDATETLGAALARTFPGAAEQCVGLYLRGDLGAGKTTCVRSLLRTFGVTGLIRSPTYTLVETYSLASLTCVHIDLYRLQGAQQVDELGLRDVLNAGCLLLVEWPEKAGRALPPADVELALSYAPGGRRARLHAQTAQGESWLRNLRFDSRLASYLPNLT